MKNIVVVQNTELGGHLALSTFLTGLLRYYKQSPRFTFSVVCGYVDKEDAIEQIRKQMHIYEMGTAYNKIRDNIRFTVKCFRQLSRLNKTLKIDIIHCLYPNSSLQAAVLYKIFVDRKVNIVYDVRSPRIEMSFANQWISASKQRIKTIMHLSEKLLIRFVDYFVFITEGTKWYYHEKYAPKRQDEKVSIIPTGVDVQQFSPGCSSQEKRALRKKLGIAPSEKVIGYVGTISKMREMSLFLSQQSDWIKNNAVKFIFIGDGDDLPHLKQMMNALELQDKCIFLGKMQQSELIPYMHIFDYGRCHLPDIFVFSNSFPLKIVEYIAAGIPVIASTCTAHITIQQKLKNIWIYKHGFADIPFDEINTQGFIYDSTILTYNRENLRLLYMHIYENLS